MNEDKRGVAKDWLRVGLTLGLVVAIVLGSWSALGYALDTGNPILIVEGNSMLPTLKDGDLVVLRGVEVEGIAEDDIIVYSSPIWKQFIVHRVVEIVYDAQGEIVGIITKGDNNKSVDPALVSDNEVIGRVIASVHGVGLMIKIFRSPQGMALLGIIIVLLVIWSTVGEFNKLRRNPANPNQHTSPSNNEKPETKDDKQGDG